MRGGIEVGEAVLGRKVSFVPKGDAQGLEKLTFNAEVSGLCGFSPSSARVMGWAALLHH